MSRALQLLIVDDEPLAHQVLLHHLATLPDIEVVAHCYSAAETLAVLAHRQIDVMLLDIQMPVLTGLDMLKVLADPPQVIITSAYAQFAIDGFALDVADYLLKPISALRLAQALHKVRWRLQARTSPQSAALPADHSAHRVVPGQYLVLKVDRELRRFEVATISCFEAYGNYVKVWQGAQFTLVNSTLKQLRQKLSEVAFVQVHKSFLVAVAHVVRRDSQQLQLSNGLQVKIGDAFKLQARQILAEDD